MAGIDIIRADECAATDTHPVAGHRISAPASSGHAAARCRLVSPPDYSLWLVSAELSSGVELTLPDVHGDEVVYVLSGSLEVDGRTCPAGGAVVIEADAHPALLASGPTHLVHMGPADPVVPVDGLNGPPLRGESVHVVGPAGTYAAIEPGRDTHYYADSTCPSCRLTLLYTSRTTEYVSATHSHSTDELIHLVWGELRLGNQIVRPGDTLAVDADRRYGFRSGPQGFGFINYRRDASQQVVERGSHPRMEGGLVNGLLPVMDLR